mmetsp:Transcript_7850/g.17377  ORF Transcript_7850/g.17377 Transcript_7850/m.17377 type:complete len:243 (-) Transcript_7850:11-739(-)
MGHTDLSVVGLPPSRVLRQTLACGAPQIVPWSHRFQAKILPSQALLVRCVAAAGGATLLAGGAKRKACARAVVQLAQSQDQPPAAEEPPATSDPPPADEEPPGTLLTSEVVDAELIGTTEESRRSRETAFDDLPMAVTGIRKTQERRPVTVEQVADEELPRAVSGSKRRRRGKGRGFEARSPETVTVEEVAEAPAAVNQESSTQPAAGSAAAEIDDRHLQVVDAVLQQTNEYLKQRREKDAW